MKLYDRVIVINGADRFCHEIGTFVGLSSSGNMWVEFEDEEEQRLYHPFELELYSGPDE